MVAKVALNNDDAWLSLVERCVRDAEVAGSNPVASMKKKVPPLGGTFFSFVSSVSEPVFQCVTAESQFAVGKFIQHPVASEPATSIEADARSGAEGAERPGDVRLAPTEAKRRTQVQILSHRFFICSVNFLV